MSDNGVCTTADTYVGASAEACRARIELWHECSDVDLALWLSDTGNLNEFRRARARTLRALVDENCHGIATHHVDVFILEPGTNRRSASRSQALARRLRLPRLRP